MSKRESMADGTSDVCRADEFDTISDEIHYRTEELRKHLGETCACNAQILEIGFGTGWLAHKLNNDGQVIATD